MLIADAHRSRSAVNCFELIGMERGSDSGLQGPVRVYGTVETARREFSVYGMIRN